MKQRRINATLKRALPPIAALALTALLILTALPWAGATTPTAASLSTNPKRINESAAAHSFIRSPFVDSTLGTTTRISAAPRLERQPLESLTALNSTDLEAEAAATERGAPLSVVSVLSAASVVQSPGTTTRVSAALHSSPVMFIENVGQFDERVRFQVRGGMGTMWLAEDAIWVTVLEKPSSPQPPSPNLGEGGDFLPSPKFGRGAGGEGQPRKGVNLRLTFPGANPHPRIEPFDRLDTVMSYFIGNDPDQWHPDVPVWGGVRYVDLYPGVNLEMTGTSGDWTWRLVFRNQQSEIHIPEARLRVEGADALALDSDRLRLTTAVGGFSLPLLTIEDLSVEGANVELAHDQTFEVTFPFSSARLLPSSSAALLQDNPDDLLYSTFLGGSGWDTNLAIAVDVSGSAYVTGWTESSDFPTTPGAFDTSHNSHADAFVAKLNADGSELVYSTFLSGASGDYGEAIAVDGVGSAYVTGWTGSSDFPTTAGAFDTTPNGNSDTFVVKFNADGSGLAYSTFLGGYAVGPGYGIAVDASGAAYVTGMSHHDSGFPTTPGAFDTTHNGSIDAFVAKLNADGSGLAYSTFLGGVSADRSNSIAVDTSGAAYVTGRSHSSDFPTTPGAFDTTLNGNSDTFVAKLNADGSRLAYSTFLGGAHYDGGGGIAVDGAGSAYVTGYTYSSDFPTTPGAFDTTHNGNYDTFVVKFNADGSGLAYSTFLGGAHNDGGGGIAVDASGVAYVTGWTDSSNFPATPGATDTTYNGPHDAFVAKLNGAGTELAYGTFLGGGSNDQGYAIAVDEAGSAYVTGYTYSSDFPTTAGAFDTSSDGGDAFVSKLAMGSGPPPAPSFGPSIKVNDDTGTARQINAVVAVDGMGNAYAVWWDRRNGGPGDIYSAKLTAGANAWGANVLVNDDPQAVDGAGFDGPAIAVDSTGNAHATWYDYRNRYPQRDIYYAKLAAGSGIWGDNIQINDVMINAGQGVPAIAADGVGNLYAVWKDWRNGDIDIYFSRSTDAGQPWTANVRVSDSISTQLDPAIAVDWAGNAYAVWEDHRNGVDIYFAKQPSGSSTWSANVRVNDEVRMAHKLAPAIAVDEAGNVFVVWWDNRNGDYDIYFSRSTDGGQTWSPDVRLNDDTSSAGQALPAIAAHDVGNVYVVWADQRTARKIYFICSTDGGQTWSANVRVTDEESVSPWAPAIAVDGAGNAYVVWEDHRNGNDDIYFAKTGGPGPTPGENPPPTPAPPPSLTDEMFDGTDPTEGYKYAAQGPIEIDIVIDRYYGPTNNGTLDSSYIGKSVAEYSWLTIQAFDVDPDEVDRVFVNDHEVGPLTGVDGGWRPDSFPIPTDWLHFPDLSSGANPPDTTHAHNTIRIEIDEGGQGRATQVAWARLEVPGTRPVLLVHGLDFVKEILCRAPICDLTRVHNGWNSWQNWVDTDSPKGFLAEYGFPNVQSATENGTQGPRTRELESDVRVYTDGLDSYKDNSDKIYLHILRLLKKYGVDKINLVGHSKGGIDIRATLKKLKSPPRLDVVENAIVMGTPNEGLLGIVGLLASLFERGNVPPDVLHELSLQGMSVFNTDQGHGLDEQLQFLHTVAGDEPNILSFGFLEQWLYPNDGTIAVSSVHGSLLPFVPPDYTHTSTLPTNHTGLHDEEFVFMDTVRPLLQPVAVGGAGAMSYATRQAGPKEEAPVRATSSGAAGNPVQYPSPIVRIISSGEVQTHTIAIDGDAASVSLMWGYADSMGLTLYDPQGQEIDPSASAAITYTASITDKTVGYILEDPETGQWTAQITATNTYTDGEDYLLVTAVSSTITMTAEVDKDWYAVNEPVQISANLRHGSAPVTGAVVTATVFFSGTTAATINLYDDGLHGDGAADDGWYTNTFTDTSQIGYYLILVSADGTSGGTAFSRVTSTQAAVASTGASLNDSYAEGLFDTNGDGLYNTLVITTGVSVTDTASYRLVGMITDTDGNYVVDAATEITLTVGVIDIPLLFSGGTIAQSGRDGPYQLRNLALLDLSSATPVQADYRALAYTTDAYTHSQFQRDPIIVSTYAADQGVDTNGNGKHDLLRITTSVDVRHAGTYTVTARLLDADWQDVASVYTTTDLVTGTNAISLDFNGAAISASGRDGPYHVSNLVITYGLDPVTYLLNTDFYTTQAYNYTDFDVAILQVLPVALTFYAQKDGANPPPKSVSIANTGGGLLDWTAIEDADWLSINPTSGTVPISMSVSVDVASLAADIYTGTITVTATISGIQNSPQEVSARLCNLFGDLNCDCVVNVDDIMEVASRWRMTSDDPEWEARYDLDGDGIITVVDIMMVAARWGDTC